MRLKLIMHILKNNKPKKIDNEKATFEQIKDKLSEECREVKTAITLYQFNNTNENLKEIAREAFDVIQMCILVLWRCHRIAKSKGDNEFIEKINIEHKNKLIDRGWTIETGIEIDVKE
jgi:NTP pyrophosphatase (non-canonical NTP hydrolase)